MNTAAEYRQLEIRSRDAMRSFGITDAEIRAAICRGEIARLAPGLYVDARLYRGLHPDQQYKVRIRAEAVRTPALVISHGSAAALHRLPLVGIDNSIVHLTRAGRGGGRRFVERWVHASDLPLQFRLVADGVDLTTVARTLVDLARTESTKTAVVAGDAALRRRLTSAAEIRDALDFARWHKGIAHAQRSLVLLDGRSESPGESLLRLSLHSQGLPEPELQVEIHDEQGRFVGRVDLALLAFGVLLEFDGKGKYQDLLKPGQTVTDAVLEEKAREERLTELGWLVIRVTWADLANPAKLAARIQQACRSRRRLVDIGAIRGSATAAAPMRIVC